MVTTPYYPDILIPLAVTLVDVANGDGQEFTPDIVDNIAEQLYRRHRSESTRRVLERTWKLLPGSEKGKYRKIVVSVLEERSL
jgi:hypothetical protein